MPVTKVRKAVHPWLRRIWSRRLSRLLVERTLPYDEIGRHCNEQEAIRVDHATTLLLDKHRIEYVQVQAISQKKFEDLAGIVVDELSKCYG